MSKVVSLWPTARLVSTTGRSASISRLSRTAVFNSRNCSTPAAWKVSSQCHQRKVPAVSRISVLAGNGRNKVLLEQNSILCQATAFRNDVSATPPSSWRSQQRPYATQPPQNSERALAKEKSRAKAEAESRREHPVPKEDARTGNHENHDGSPLEHQSFAHSMSKYLNLPHLPPRPTKEELLAAATGFWQRLKVRFKWASIRDIRPWNIDEWGAFVSWFMLGHIVWILVGTTTFFSIVILSINTVFAQGMLPKDCSAIYLILTSMQKQWLSGLAITSLNQPVST